MLMNLSEVLAEPHKTIVQDVTSETKSVRIGGKEFDIFQLPGDLRLQAADQETHFLHLVFQGCAGHKERILRLLQ